MRRPSQFSRAEWKAILLRVKDEIGRDNLSLIAAGVAFYAMLSFFPAIASLVALYGFVADPATIGEHLAAIGVITPSEVFDLIETQIESLTTAAPTTLGLTSVLSLLFSFWSARSGVNALITGLNIAYNETDDRGFFAGLLTSLALTAVMLIVALIALSTTILIPVTLSIVDLGFIGEWIARIAKWPIFLIFVVVALALCYRFGPHRSDARIQWLSWGAGLAAAIWLVGSLAFSIYVANFANYNKTYGSIGAVIGLLMWFYLSAFIVLVGAELNAEMERQTKADTTVGPDAPMGRRGAVVADDYAGESGDARAASTIVE